jgi:hypothetical protein
MKQISADEFEEQIDRYLTGDLAVAVRKNGATVGYYLPVPSADDGKFREALARLEQTTKRVLEETGMSEDDLANLFDLTRPFPYPTDGEMPAIHAPGR